MHTRSWGFGGLFALVALVGCGSSNGSGGTGGSGNTGGAAGAGNGAAAGHTGTGGTGGAKATGGTGGAQATGGTTGTGGGNSGAFTTSVSSGTKLTALTSAQATQFCSDLQKFFDNTFIPTICNSSANVAGAEAAYVDLIGNPSATDSELRAACTAASADAGPNGCTDALVDGGTGSCDISSVPTTCQATVGQYTTCINDTNRVTGQFYAAFPSCSTLTAASVKALFAADGGASQGPPEPTSCSMFDSTCSVDGGTSTKMSPPAMARMKHRGEPTVVPGARGRFGRPLIGFWARPGRRRGVTTADRISRPARSRPG